MTDTKLLREWIKKSGLKLSFIAEKLSLSRYGLQRKIENASDFRTGEVAILCELLGISDIKEKERIFFAQRDDGKSSGKETA